MVRPELVEGSLSKGHHERTTLVKLIEQQEVTAAMSVEIERFSSQNVVANMRGRSDDGRVVILGAHYDTVEDTQGVHQP